MAGLQEIATVGNVVTGASHVHRPWGWFTLLGEPDEMPIAAVKTITVEPGHALSLQFHDHRRERWMPLSHGLVAEIGHEHHELRPGHLYDIGIGVLHRLRNAGSSVGLLVEIMYGVYREDDIHRLDDHYGRTS